MKSIIVSAIEKKAPLEEVMDLFLKEISKPHLSRYLFSAFDNLNEVIKYVKKKDKSNIELMDRFIDDIEKNFHKQNLQKELIKHSFTLFLNYSFLSEKWNMTQALSEDERIDLFYNVFKKDDVIAQFKFRKINTNLYSNEQRKGKSQLNFKERAIALMLYADGHCRTTRKKILDFAMQEFQSLSIDKKLMSEKIHIKKCYPQNFLFLPENVQELLNENIYSIKVYDKNFNLKLQDAIAYNALNIAARNGISGKYTIYDLQGKPFSANVEQLIEAYNENLAIKELMPKFLLMKYEDAKTKENKTIWLKALLDKSVAQKSEEENNKIKKTKI